MLDSKFFRLQNLVLMTKCNGKSVFTVHRDAVFFAPADGFDTYTVVSSQV